MSEKDYAREKVCASFIDANIDGLTLNIGAGQMQWIEKELFKDNLNFISSDIDPKNLGSQNPTKRKIVADATRIPLKDKEISQVIILDVLEHIKDHEKALDEIYRILKTGGILVICVPNDTYLSYINPIRYAQHERHYTIKQIKNLLEKHGFKIERVFAGGRIWDLVDLYVHLIIKHLTGRKVKFKFLTKMRDKEYLKHHPYGNEIAIKSVKI